MSLSQFFALVRSGHQPQRNEQDGAQIMKRLRELREQTVPFVWEDKPEPVENGAAPTLNSVYTYGHLIPGANISFVDRLDEKPSDTQKTTSQQSASPAQHAE